MNLKPPSKENPPIDQVYTLEDLKTWPYAGKGLAVIGHPVAHSLSPVMHSAALAKICETAPEFSDWYYVKFDIDPNDLPSALKLFYKAGFQGLNLTVPHKTIALPHIDIQEDIVFQSGASNTLKRGPKGFQGFNTDPYGLFQGIKHSLGIEVKDFHVLLLGAGGAARSAAAQCLQSGVKSLHLANRSQDRLDSLIKDLKQIPSTTPLHRHSLPGPVDMGNEPFLVINATSLGLKAEDPSPVNLGTPPTGSYAYDMIYGPRESAFLTAAKNAGMTTANGLSMLVFQGLRSLTLWTGQSPSAAVMLTAVRSFTQS